MAPIDEVEPTALASMAAIGEAAMCDPDAHHGSDDQPTVGLARFHTKPTQVLTPEEITAFSEKWRLDAASAKFLWAMAPDAQKAVVSEFSPPEGTQSTSARFCAFARTRAARLAPQPVGAASLSPVSAAPRAPVPPPGLQPMGADGAADTEATDPIGDFVSRWKLNNSSVALLRGLPGVVREALLADFSPSPETRNVHGKLQAYAHRLLRARATAPQAENSADAARSRWSFDSDASEVLRGLPADVQTVFLADFRPAIGSADVSRQFCAFVKLRTSERTRGGRFGHSSDGQLCTEAVAPPVGGIVAKRSARPESTEATEARAVGQATRGAKRGARPEPQGSRPTPTLTPPPAPPSRATRWERDGALASGGANSWTPSLAAHSC